MCGVVGIVSNTQVSQDIYSTLMVLQHRGQDAAGIATCDDKQLHLRKDNGLVSSVFNKQHHMDALAGNVGIGHVRYPTAGHSSDIHQAQPLYVNSPYGICLAHNGNLINTDELVNDLFRTDLRHINTSSDSEVLLNVLAHELQDLRSKDLQVTDIFTAVTKLHQRCKGAYAIVAIIIGHGLLAIRDPYGIRPMVLGKKIINNKASYIVASESVALDSLGYTLVRDVAPGEAIYITNDGELYNQSCTPHPKLYPCIFEYIYLARPDSIIDSISVHKTRMVMGRRLADNILNTWPDHDIDVVIPVPDTSRVIALELAQKLGINCREGLVKNRYIGRTFIMAGQAKREKSVKQKLNKINLEFEGKNVLLVDDSIVRGTTSKQIVDLAREAGAKKVYFASAAPAIRYPNVYGIDMPVDKELIACNRSTAEICREIGADRLIYQSLDDLVASCKIGNNHVDGFDASVFDGTYVAGNLSNSYIDKLSRERANAKIG